VLPAPTRTPSGYRIYAANDLRRLRLIRRARLLGLSLAEARRMAEQAFRSECADYGRQLLERIGIQRAALAQQMVELRALQDELDAIEWHVRHAKGKARPGQRVADCRFCPLIDDDEVSDDHDDRTATGSA